MVEVLKRLGTRPGVTTELMIATLFTNLLALASPLFVIQVLNRYVTFGVDATLRTLVFGVLIAIVLEFGFREIRMRLAQGLAIKPDEALALAVFGTLTAAKTSALEQVPPGVRRQAKSKSPPYWFAAAAATWSVWIIYGTSNAWCRMPSSSTSPKPAIWSPVTGTTRLPRASLSFSSGPSIR